MITMVDTKLKQIRTSLKATQEQVLRRTKSVSLSTLKNAENGRRVTNDTAQQILGAINELLQEAGRDTVTLDDLGLTIY